MNRYLGIFILVALTNGLWGQSSQNPFDLKYRKSIPSSSREKKNEVVRSDTVKEITPPASTQPLPADAKVVVQDTSGKDYIGISFDSSSTEQNPFETDVISDSTSIVSPNKSEVAEDAVGNSNAPAPNKHYVSRGFQIFFLLLSLLFLIFIVNVERSFIRDLWRVISNENYSSLHHRNQRNTMRQILLLMGYLIFIFQAGLFINQSLHIYQYSGSVLSSIWISIAVVLGVYLVRHGVIRYLKWLFNNDKELSLFAFDISIFNTMVGLILLPINILLVFGPEGLYNTLIIIGIVVMAVAYLMRQLRWMFASRRLIFNSLFLFFIYLCAVEILPLWTISKIFW